MNIEQLPIPRLQFVWRKPTDDETKQDAADWICVYQLILPGGPHDIRRPDGANCVTVEMGKTSSRGGANVRTDAPYRDGAHSLWDAKSLGGLPIFIVGSDGEARPHVAP